MRKPVMGLKVTFSAAVVCAEPPIWMSFMFIFAHMWSGAPGSVVAPASLMAWQIVGIAYDIVAIPSPVAQREHRASLGLLVPRNPILKAIFNPPPIK